MSSKFPIIASSSSTMSVPSLEMTGKQLFPYYFENFFSIPNDISRDIIYCQRALKAHIKVHQMVLDVFQQQHDADPKQKERILEELESEIYEINAEQNFLFLRIRRIIDEFTKTLNKNSIPVDTDAINTFVSQKLVPHINDSSFFIKPSNVMMRRSEEQLIEKYFEVQKDVKTYEQMEVIDLDDDDNDEEEFGTYKAYSNIHKRGHNNATSSDRASLLKNLHTKEAASQPSLLKPFNQRMSHDFPILDVKPIINKPIQTLGDYYKKKKEEKFLQEIMGIEVSSTADVKPNIMKPIKPVRELCQQKTEEKEKELELPVSTNVKISRLNLIQALKRAQAAVRGPTNASTPNPVPPPPQPGQAPAIEQSIPAVREVVVKKSYATKPKPSKATIASSAYASRKSPVLSSSSREGTPERVTTPSNNYWPDEYEETCTKPEECGQEMFLKMFELYTPACCAKMRIRRSKRARRCVQNNNYHYGKLDTHSSNPPNEPAAKKKRKAFLLSPQVKKNVLPRKSTKRHNPDNGSVSNSASTSRSSSSSPNEKRTCNKCLKNGLNLEQCEECKLFYHAKCHREEDDPTFGVNPKKDLSDLKKCPSCKKKYDKAIKKDLLHHENLQHCAEDLELKIAKEKDRHEILERTSNSYKIQLGNLLNILKKFRNEDDSADEENITNVIQLD